MGVVMLLLVGCSSDDDANFGSGDSDVIANSPTALYAIVSPEGSQMYDLIPNDYVMTLDNIIAVNPETGEFKMKDTEKISQKLILYQLNTSFSSIQESSSCLMPSSTAP